MQARRYFLTKPLKRDSISHFRAFILVSRDHFRSPVEESRVRAPATNARALEADHPPQESGVRRFSDTSNLTTTTTKKRETI